MKRTLADWLHLIQRTAWLSRMGSLAGGFLIAGGAVKAAAMADGGEHAADMTIELAGGVAGALLGQCLQRFRPDPQFQSLMQTAAVRALASLRNEDHKAWFDAWSKRLERADGLFAPGGEIALQFDDREFRELWWSHMEADLIRWRKEVDTGFSAAVPGAGGLPTALADRLKRDLPDRLRFELDEELKRSEEPPWREFELQVYRTILDFVPQLGRIEDNTKELLRRVPPQSPPPIDVDQAVDRLRTQVEPSIRATCGTLRILTMEQPINLAGVYTDVQILKSRTAHRRLTVEQLTATARSGGRDAFDRLGLAEHTGPRTPGEQALRNNPRLLVYGKPGAGKTTFLKRVAMECVEGRLHADKVPVFLPLKPFGEGAASEGAASLQEAIRGEWADDAAAQAVLAAGRAFVLLDGLDEVTTAQHDRVKNAVERFVRVYPLCPVALTCRIAARQYVFQTFTEVEVADFTPEQVRAFVTGWFQTRGQPGKSEQFLRALRLDSRSPFAELASRPLLIALMCLVFEEMGRLGESRAALYRELLDLLLKRWDEKHGIDRDWPPEVSRSNLEFFLGQLAYEEFLKDRYLFQKADLEVYATQFFRTEASHLLRKLEAHTGLLVERAMGVYSFSHLTLQEYLAALHVAGNHQHLQTIGAFVGDRRWREIWRTLVCELSDAATLIRRLLQFVNDLRDTEPNVRSYLVWCNRKAARSQSRGYKPPAVRAFYFDMNRAIERSRALDMSLARAIDASLNAAAAQDFRRALALDRTLAINPALDPVLLFDLALSRALDRAINGDVDDALEYALDLSVALATSLAPEMNAALKEARQRLPRSAERRRWWGEEGDRWTNDLQHQLIQHRDVGHRWHWTPPHRELLWRYYRANLLLAECLNAAQGLPPAVRQEIEDQMLMPTE